MNNDKLVQIDHNKIPVKNRIGILRYYLNKISFEREQAIDVILASCITGLPVCLYGWPGTGKTMLIEAIAKASSGKYAYVLGNQTMKPSELAGVPDMKKLREDSKLHYNTEDRIFDADFGFLDEAGKAPSYALNLMLRAMNEKRGPNNEPINLTLFLASNEPMQSPAFLDRIVCSLWFDDVKGSDNRRVLKLRELDLEPTPSMPEGFLSPDDFKSVGELVKKEVTVSKEIVSVLDRLESVIYLDKLTGSGTDIPPRRVSTRKAVWILRMLRTIAWVRGQSEVTLDLIEEIYPLALWHDPSDQGDAIKAVREVIEEVRNVKGELEQEIKEIGDQLIADLEKEELLGVASSIKEIKNKVSRYGDLCAYLMPEVENLESLTRQKIKDVDGQAFKKLSAEIESHCAAAKNGNLEQWNNYTAHLLNRLKEIKAEKAQKMKLVEQLRFESMIRNDVVVEVEVNHA
jgi:MoxR-like ATPase